MDDYFHRIYGLYIDWAGNIPDSKLLTIIRLTLLFAVPTAIYYWAFISGRRGGFSRLVAAVLADGLVLAVPIHAPYDLTARAWIFTGCIMALAYSPGSLPFLVYREAGRQRRLRLGLYVLMAVLLVVGLLWN